MEHLQHRAGQDWMTAICATTQEAQDNRLPEGDTVHLVHTRNLSVISQDDDSSDLSS